MATPLHGPSFMGSASVRNPATGRKSIASSADEFTAKAQRTTSAVGVRAGCDIGILLRDIIIWTPQDLSRKPRFQSQFLRGPYRIWGNTRSSARPRHRSMGSSHLETGVQAFLKPSAP